jgi:hypothetical protein
MSVNSIVMTSISIKWRLHLCGISIQRDQLFILAELVPFHYSAWIMSEADTHLLAISMVRMEKDNGLYVTISLHFDHFASSFDLRTHLPLRDRRYAMTAAS